MRALHLLLWALIYFTSNAITQPIPSSLQKKTAAYLASRKYTTSVRDKIDSHILALLQPKKTISAEATTPPFITFNSRGELHITLRVTEITSQLKHQLTKAGFHIETTTENLPVTGNQQMITGWISLEKLTRVAQLAAVFFVRPADKPRRHIGDVTSEGDQFLRAVDARNFYAVSGIDQKIGVISDGIDHYKEVQASADLPEIDIVRNYDFGDEGTAMLEIAHDLAPRAALAFADWGDSQADFANNIYLLRDAGCNIITDDVIYLFEPVYEDGVIAQTVEDVVLNSDVFYTSSACNLETHHYEGDFSDQDKDGYHEFDQIADETLDISVDADMTLYVVMQWNNQFGKASDDYNLYIYNDSLSTILASSTNLQNGDDDPLEYTSYENTSQVPVVVKVAVQLASGDARNLTLHFYESFGRPGINPLEYASSGGTIFGHAGAAHCFTTGAIDFTNIIEEYSSMGPVRIYHYDENGLPFDFEERNKPDCVALDGVQTKVGQLGYFANPFYGTSAATPHAAGIAALVREAGSYLTAVEVQELLNNTSVDLGTTGFDNIYGNGRIDAYNAIAQLGEPAHISTFPESLAVSLAYPDSQAATLNITNTGDLTLHFQLSASKLTRNVKIYERQHFPRNIRSLATIKKAPQNEAFFFPNTAINDGVLLFEGFESGEMPPAGWEKIDGNSSPGQQAAHWSINDNPSYVLEGNYSAFCPWGYNLDEWLITPTLDFSTLETAQLTFYWQSSYHWNVDPNDNGDLFVEISTDNGVSWKKLWTFGDIGAWTDWAWYQTTLDLGEYCGQPAVKIAFHVIANDNADIVIENVQVTQPEPEQNYVRFSPASGIVNKDSTAVVNLTFYSQNFSEGNYTGAILIHSNAPADTLANIPLTLVISDDSSHTLSGNINYYSHESAVPEVVLRLISTVVDSTISDSSGNYSFSGLSTGTYSLKPVKPTNFKTAVTTADASLIMKYDVGLTQLTPYQKLAADVSGNHRVSHYDAALILQYCAGLIDDFPGGTGWRFVPTNFMLADTNWFTAPDSIYYNQLNKDSTHQDFTALITGDVNGDWENTPSFQPINAHFFLNKENINSRHLSIPLLIDYPQPIFSGEIVGAFDSAALEVNSVNVMSSAESLIFEYCSQNGKLKIAFASGKGVVVSDTLFIINFKKKQLAPQFIKLEKIELNGNCTLLENTALAYNARPINFYLSENYPNPFNPGTTIKYNVPQPAEVILSIYNTLGQEIRRLVDSKKTPGRYSIFWDGKDSFGLPVASGIYFYQLKIKTEKQLLIDQKKMVLIR